MSRSEVSPLITPTEVTSAIKDTNLAPLSDSALTVGQTVQRLHQALQDYIEATYHVSHPALVAERRELLSSTGVISQRPFFESTPRYRTERRFQDVEGLSE